jgi:transposase
VERPAQGTNTALIFDPIPFLVKPHKQKPQVYRDLYLKKGLSAAQIAERLGCARTTVLERLRRQGIRKSGGRMTNPDNYRLHEPPYGFSKVGGRLVPNKAEMRICRLIVELRERQGLSALSVSKELQKRGVSNRRGSATWSHHSVIRIFNRWKEKI